MRIAHYIAGYVVRSASVVIKLVDDFVLLEAGEFYRMFEYVLFGGLFEELFHHAHVAEYDGEKRQHV